MRIRELFEGNFFKDADYVQAKEGGEREINYDLVDDIAHFMEQDDHCYRRFFHPALDRFLHVRENKKDPKPEIFKEAVKECYKIYVQKFPIRELPDELDEDTLGQVCEKLYDEHSTHHADGKYKD
jgi:hypothetical protein